MVAVFLAWLQYFCIVAVFLHNDNIFAWWQGQQLGKWHNCWDCANIVPFFFAPNLSLFLPPYSFCLFFCSIFAWWQGQLGKWHNCRDCADIVLLPFWVRGAAREAEGTELTKRKFICIWQKIFPFLKCSLKIPFPFLSPKISITFFKKCHLHFIDKKIGIH